MMMRRVAASLVPPWLEPLLSAHFFTACPLHRDAPRSECNMFCIDCGPASSSFCFYCRSDNHAGHRVIQIRRSSYHDVVRVAEIQKMLDISGVQTYVINSAPVLFLNERPQPRGGGRGGGASAASSSTSTPYTCEICSRSLLDPFRFCSLGCKEIVRPTQILYFQSCSSSTRSQRKYTLQQQQHCLYLFTSMVGTRSQTLVVTLTRTRLRKARYLRSSEKAVEGDKK
ncbi:protein RGF1 INDUCIBLE TRANSCRIPTION FACTOR 1-like isoform X2 [Musa acuminata AAA Group]|uniref:protein RGF1 INDUCIBLE TRANSCRIPTION FACTOR 1-like isoform X2 n=1 Tax=Musa acuminata AAA Group TaxID=214697 RepID=UPI0031CFB314